MVGLAELSGQTLAAVPFTTSIVLVMAAPASPQAQPRNVVLGHLLSALAGLVVLNLIGGGPWPAALAVGLAIGAMQLCDALHPPAGINALLVPTLQLPWLFVAFPVLSGALALVTFAWLYHRVTAPGDWPRRWF